MELGGNIVLEGFDSIDPGKLIVIKKIAGSFVKKIGDLGDYEKVIFGLEGEYKITISEKRKENELNSESEDKNLFFALTNAIKSLEAEF